MTLVLTWVLSRYFATSTTSMKLAKIRVSMSEIGQKRLQISYLTWIGFVKKDERLEPTSRNTKGQAIRTLFLVVARVGMEASGATAPMVEAIMGEEGEEAAVRLREKALTNTMQVMMMPVSVTKHQPQLVLVIDEMVVNPAVLEQQQQLPRK
jgi:hypothetical protein